MASQPFIHVAETEKPFQAALVAVRRAAEAARWGVRRDGECAERLSQQIDAELRPILDVAAR
jgi:hypothetical protein